MKIKSFVNRPIEENTYIVSDTATKEAVIIDCGARVPADQAAIAAYVAEEGLTIKHHVLTHGHFDHMFGAQWVADTYGCLPRLHAADTDFYLNASEMVSTFFHRRMDFDIPRIGAFFNEGDIIAFGDHHLHVIHTPGHTPGGCCLYCPEEGVLFSGDSLFCSSIGRTDLERGDHAALIHSLHEKILTLPAAVKVYPGHGPSTTIENEQSFNPYL